MHFLDRNKCFNSDAHRKGLQDSVFWPDGQLVTKKTQRRLLVEFRERQRLRK